MPDLGSDKIWRLGRVNGKKVGHWQINGYIQQPVGSGPRHIQVVGSLYLISQSQDAFSLMRPWTNSRKHVIRHP